MKRKSKVYRNRIDEMLGITADSLREIQRLSPLHRQRQRQRTRWAAHRARKEAS